MSNDFRDRMRKQNNLRQVEYPKPDRAPYVATDKELFNNAIEDIDILAQKFAPPEGAEQRYKRTEGLTQDDYKALTDDFFGQPFKQFAYLVYISNEPDVHPELQAALNDVINRPVLSSYREQLRDIEDIEAFVREGRHLERIREERLPSNRDDETPQR